MYDLNIITDKSVVYNKKKKNLINTNNCERKFFLEKLLPLIKS